MDDVEMLAVARKAVGDEFEIMFDRTAVRPGWVWDYDTALQVARGMEKYNARWLEEPFDGHDLEGPARLAAEVDIPITGGELGKSIYQFLAFLTHKTYDVLQPDTRICGGILNARKISILAEAFQVPCIQHGTQGLSLAGYIQAGCAMPNCEYQEMIGQPNLPDEMNFGDLRLLPLAPGEKATFTAEPARGFDLGYGPGKRIEREVRGGTVGLIIDARGRPLELPAGREECRAAIDRWITALDLYPQIAQQMAVVA